MMQMSIVLGTYSIPQDYKELEKIGFNEGQNQTPQQWN